VNRNALAADLRASLVAAALLAVPGLLAILTGRVLLFASLGPSAVIVAHSPGRRSSRVYNIVVSHLIGAGCAATAVHLLGLALVPSVFDVGYVSGLRVVAAVGALASATFLELRFGATHVPAASTTLLVALGSLRPDPYGLALVAVGVIVVALAGVPGRRLAGQQPDR
jgi:hypothetical protein